MKGGGSKVKTTFEIQKLTHLNRISFEKLGNVDSERQNNDRSKQFHYSFLGRLGRYSGPVIVGVADGHVSLVGNGHHNEDGDGQDDVGHGVDEVGERLAVQVEVQVQASDNGVVQNGHP